MSSGKIKTPSPTTKSPKTPPSYNIDDILGIKRHPSAGFYMSLFSNLMCFSLVYSPCNIEFVEILCEKRRGITCFLFFATCFVGIVQHNCLKRLYFQCSNCYSLSKGILLNKLYQVFFGQEPAKNCSILSGWTLGVP